MSPEGKITPSLEKEDTGKLMNWQIKLQKLTLSSKLKS